MNESDKNAVTGTSNTVLTDAEVDARWEQILEGLSLAATRADELWRRLGSGLRAEAGPSAGLA